jgi:hypothetical protein
MVRGQKSPSQILIDERDLTLRDMRGVASFAAKRVK